MSNLIRRTWPRNFSSLVKTANPFHGSICSAISTLSWRTQIDSRSPLMTPRTTVALLPILSFPKVRCGIWFRISALLEMMISKVELRDSIELHKFSGLSRKFVYDNIYMECEFENFEVERRKDINVLEWKFSSNSKTFVLHPFESLHLLQINPSLPTFLSLFEFKSLDILCQISSVELHLATLLVSPKLRTFSRFRLLSN
jgi:hypothetical protein